MKQTLKTNREERLEQIRAVRQHIIDNAETILGAEKYRTDLIIEATFLCSELPTITVHRSAIPDGFIEKPVRI